MQEDDKTNCPFCRDGWACSWCERQMKNNKYTIKVKHPLVRPGLEIETEASEKYLVQVIMTLIRKVRELNEKDSK